MYIGKINDKYGPIEWSTAQSVTGKSVQYKEAGDPFRVERLTIDWSELVPFGLELTFLIPWEIQLSEVVLRFGSKSEPPFPPPKGRPVREFLKICSNPKNFKILEFCSLSDHHVKL